LSINRLGVHGIGMKVVIIIAFALSLNSLREILLPFLRPPPSSHSRSLSAGNYRICKSNKYMLNDIRVCICIFRYPEPGVADDRDNIIDIAEK